MIFFAIQVSNLQGEEDISLLLYMIRGWLCPAHIKNKKASVN